MAHINLIGLSKRQNINRRNILHRKMPFQQTGFQKELCVRKYMDHIIRHINREIYRRLPCTRFNFSENSTTESIQTFNVKAKFQVKTFTALNKLEVADDCDCDA